MSETSLSQAVRNAVEAERAAARFYRALLPQCEDEETRSFIRSMAASEDAHAEAIEERGRALVQGELALHANIRVEAVEALPYWRMVERISFAEALNLALEAELQAALYYDALADYSPGPVAEFLRELSQEEEQHARALRQRIPQYQ